MEPYLETMAAAQGTFVVNNTTEKTLDFDCLMVLEDTVFTSLKIGGVDKRSDYMADTAGTTKAGAIIRATSGQKFSGVQLTSGSVILVR